MDHRTVEKRTLGRTNAVVSALGFGGAPAGLTGYMTDYNAADQVAQQTAERALGAAIDAGVTYFDTAPGYGSGISEEIYGRALGNRRADVFLATKTSRGKWSPEGIRESLEESLRRLGTDAVDLLQFHGGWLTDEDVTNILDRGGLETYERLRDEGKVRYLGFTAEGANGAVERLIATGRFDTMMMCFNLVYQGAGAYRNGDLPSETALSLARAQGMGIITMRSLTSGVFQRWLSQVAPNLVDQLDWNAYLLGFVLSHPQVDVCLAGMRTADEVAQNIATASDPKFRVDMQQMHDAYLGRR